MGVKNLWPILSPIHERKSLWELHDKILAIDLSCWVCDSQHIELHNQPRMYLRNLFFRTSCLLLLGVKPIFVLEGKAPELKHFVMSQRVQHRNRNKKQNSSSEEESIKGLEVGKKGRNKGSRSHFNSILKQCQELLRIMGVACVQSLGEAEALCAQLDEAELVDGCISQDGDCFLYGARTVYRNFTISSHGTSGYSVDEYKMTAVEEKLALSRRKLIALSLLCGCDYNDKGVLGIGKETAMKFLESLKDDEVLNRLKKWRVDPIYMSLENEYQSLDNICSKCTHPGKLQKHAKRGCDLCDTQSDCTETTDEHLIRKDPEEKKIIIAELTMRRKALKDETFPSQDMIDEFLHKQPLPDLDITWKQPDISSFLKYSVKLLSWTEEYAVEKFVPVVTRWQIHHLQSVTENTEKQMLPLIPLLIVKTRVLKGIKSFEVRWEDSHGLLQSVGQIEDMLVTVEPQELFRSAYPAIVEEFVKEKEAKTKKGKGARKPKTKGKSSEKCLCRCEENGENNTQSTQQGHLCTFVKSGGKSSNVSDIQDILRDLNVNSEVGKAKQKPLLATDKHNEQPYVKRREKQAKLTFSYFSHKIAENTVHSENRGKENTEKNLQMNKENIYNLHDEYETKQQNSVSSNKEVHSKDDISLKKYVEHELHNFSLNEPAINDICEQFECLDVDDEITDLSSIICGIVGENSNENSCED